HPDVEAGFLRDAESPAETHALRRAALFAVIAVVSVRSAEGSGGGLRPCVRIQRVGLLWIETMAVQIHRVERHSGDTVGKRSLEEQIVEVRSLRRGGNWHRKSGLVRQNSSKGPVLRYPRYDLVSLPSRRSSIGERKRGL